MIAQSPSLPRESSGKGRQTRFIRVGLGLPPYDIVRHHIDIPETPDLLAKPAGFHAEPRHFRALQNGSADRERASQSAQADPQLVRPFGIVQLPDHRDIRGDLIEALAKDVACRLLGDLSPIECNVLGIAGRERRVDPSLFREQTAARRLGKAGEPQAPLRNQ
nr:hypothetical protein [Mesorhizobium sp.]